MKQEPVPRGAGIPGLKAGEDVNPERCEWNPAHDIPSLDPPRPDDCTNTATVSAGTRNNWHLCDDCAARPKFRRFKKIPLARRTR